MHPDLIGMHPFYEERNAMLITKFNKLIHNKIIWAAIAVLVSLAMVGLFSPKSRGGNTQANKIGQLFGEPVTRDELMRAKLYVQAFQPSRGGEDEQKMIQDEAWRRLAIRRYAQKLGINVSNQEIAETIARDPSFAVNGVFSRQRYQQLVERQIGVPREVFEDYLRDELVMQKMQAVVGTTLWIAPAELQQSVERFTDKFTLDVVTLSASNLVSDVTASETEIREFYDDNPILFNAPELRSVTYVEWPVAEIAKTVNVSEMEIQDAYDRDIENYSITDTNTMTVSYTPLEEVEGEIREKLAAKAALGIAGEYAMQFLDDLSMMDYGDPVTIHSVAKKRGLNVNTSELFSAISPPDTISAGRAFAQAAFQLDPEDVTKSYSGTVIGDDAVYVMAWYTNRPAFLQPFEDVTEQATELATEQARYAAFTKRVEDIHQELSKAVTSEEEFKKAVETRELTAKTVGPFSVYDADPEEIPFFSDIAPTVLPLQAGELAEPVSTSQDETLIIYVADRVHGDIAEAEALKPDITRMLQSGRMRMHIAEWSQALLERAKTEGEQSPEANDTSDADEQ
jgi:hypothetical protein